MRTISLVCAGACLLVGTVRGQENLDELLPVRGFCIAAPRPDHIAAFLEFITNDLAPRHINTLVLRVDYNFQFTRRPEMADKEGLSVDDARQLSAVCRAHGIHLIPLIDLLGHQSWASTPARLLRAHPEFDETPWVKMTEPYKWPNPDKLYCKSYCPLAPGLHDVIFDCIDEVCDAFQADTFHAGMDEVFYIGESKCPRCGGKDPAELFAGEVKAIDEHLKQQGRSLWIWGDRLLDGHTTGLGQWEASEVHTARAIDLIPKDVTICDWHYDLPAPTPVYFAVKGFRVISCPYRKSWVATDDVDDMVHWRQSVPKKMVNRFQGVMQTAWNSAEGFLAKDRPSAARATNAWNSLVAMTAEIERQSDGQRRPPR